MAFINQADGLLSGERRDTPLSMCFIPSENAAQATETVFTRRGYLQIYKVSVPRLRTSLRDVLETGY